MRSYIVRITMPDGSQGHHQGAYTDGFAALIRAIEMFPQAKRVSARRSA